MSKKKFNHQWDRVKKTDLSENETKRQSANKSILTNDVFLNACKLCNINPTSRQASKWNNKKGKAFKY